MTRQQAVDAAAAENTIITADKSFIVDGTVTIPSGKTITLTDEGKGLSVVFENGFTGPAFRVEQGAALILDGSFNFSCFRIANGSFAEVNGAMTLNGGTITRMSLSGSNMGAITVDGGSFTMGNGELSSISASSANCGAVYVKNGGKFAMNGGKITGCTFKNQYSGAVALADGNMTMTDGTISGNTASEYNAAGGVLVNGTSSLAMSGGTIADNTAKRGGGACVRENGTFTMSGGTISGNSTAVDSATIQQPNAGGGGVFVEDKAAFEMTNGTITGNKTNGMGGGVATAVLSENDTVGGGRFHMTGGTISDNTASCGGGVYSWSGRDRVVLEGGNIVNNTAYRQGGGVYVSHAPWSITIKNALITANKATIQGGGIWSCPVGTVSLGMDAAVFGNSADDAAFLLKWNETYSTSFSGKMYGGGLVTWYRDTSIAAGDPNYGVFGGDRYDAANPGAPVEPVSGAIKGYGLKAVVSAESKALAETAPLKIMGNTAERGGGVGTNGEVIIPGEDTLENPVSLTVHKVWSGTSAYPTAVTVNLIRIAKDGTRTAIGTVLLSERSTDKDGKTWSYTFANLDGAYTYTVEEEAVDGFNTSISGSMADGFTITNSKKSGGGGGGGGAVAPTTYDVVIPSALANIVKADKTKAAAGDTVTLTAAGEGTLTVTDANGKTVALTDLGSGKYTFKMPSSKVNVAFAASGETKPCDGGKDCPSAPFKDVDTGKWYHVSIDYVLTHSIMNGVSGTSFAPNSNLTRGMLVQILFNLEGKPQSASASFSDVKVDAWYAKAVGWAAANKVVTGYADGTFRPNAAVTREQAAAILYRYAQSKGIDVSVGEDTNILSYADALQASEYAIPALQWAVGAGVLNGKSGNLLAPTGTATRAEIAAIMQRWCEKIVQK